MTDYEAFAITAVGPTGVCQGTTSDGRVREFALVVHRNLDTDELSLDVARHYSDPRSLAAFVGSEPWGVEEA